MSSSFLPPTAELDAGAAPKFARASACLLSLAAHLALMILAAVFFRPSPPRVIVERDRVATIVLARRTAGDLQYFQEDVKSFEESHSSAQSAASQSGSANSVVESLPTDEPPPVVAGAALPTAEGVLPAADSLVASPSVQPGAGRPRLFPGQDDAAILAEDAGIPREEQPTGPTAELSLFGAHSVGRSFAFVIDRSASMGDKGVGAIRAAANELNEQLGSLTPQQTMQVIAYNEAAVYLGKERTLIPATDGNKTLLTSFVAGLAAFGPTEHSRGLIAGLKLRPEVIYLLTDGGPPALDAGQLRAIGELAGGRTTIHVLHFGKGEAGEGHAFLRRLAAENRGVYAYIDMAGR